MSEYEIRRDVAYPKVSDVLRMVEHADRLGFDRDKCDLKVIISIKEDGSSNVVRRATTPVGLILVGALDDDSDSVEDGAS